MYYIIYTPAPGIVIMYDKTQTFNFLKRRRQIDLVNYLNFIARHLKIETISRQNMNFEQFEYLLSKSSYKYLCQFNAQKGHHHSIEKILKEFGIVSRKRFVVNDKLKSEIKDYRDFVTDKHNIRLRKHHLQRERTFDNLTYTSLKKFIEYLVEVKGLEPTRFEDHLELFPDYCYYLLKKYKTETFQIRTRFISSFISFLIATKRVTKKDKKTILKVKKTIKKIKQRVTYVDGKNAKKQEERAKTDIRTIIAGIKHVETLYENSYEPAFLKALVVLRLLTHMGWRARNVRELQIGKNIFYEKGKWWYSFTPDEQKAPQRQGKKLKNISGEFPSILQKDIIEICNNKNSGDYIIKTQRNNVYTSSSFSKYVATITQKYIGIDLNPHVFRKIVMTYLVKSGFDNIKADLFLWHKPKSLSDVDKHYFDVDINDAVLSANKELVKLYKDKGKIIKWEGVK